MKKTIKNVITKFLITIVIAITLVFTFSSNEIVEAKGTRRDINYSNYSNYSISSEFELKTDSDNTVYVVIYKSNEGAMYERTNFFGTPTKHFYGAPTTVSFMETESSSYDISLSISRTQSISATVLGSSVVKSATVTIGGSVGLGYKVGSGAKFIIDETVSSGTYQIAECAFVKHYLVDVYSANMIEKTVTTTSFFKGTTVTTEMVQEGFYSDVNLGYSGIELLIQEDSSREQFYELVRIGD